MTNITLKDGKNLNHQDAYICDNGTHYQALAVDSEDKECFVFWLISNEDAENETDESNMCDWDTPSSIVYI